MNGNPIAGFDAIYDVLAEDGTIAHAQKRADLAEKIATNLGWLDAGRTAYEAFERLGEAKTLGDQSEACIALSNAMSDLISWHPAWDWERGVLRESED